jgi:hypothetical protein
MFEINVNKSPSCNDLRTNFSVCKMTPRTWTVRPCLGCPRKILEVAPLENLLYKVLYEVTFHYETSSDVKFNGNAMASYRESKTFHSFLKNCPWTLIQYTMAWLSGKLSLWVLCTSAHSWHHDHPPPQLELGTHAWQCHEIRQLTDS